jgi:serine/threonine-protein kinase
VHVLLVGQLPDGAMYIVMEFLDGMSLQSALAAAGGAVPLPRALHIAVQLCDAAGEAHAQGIVHRDLKPENVMLVSRADDPDFVKVLDFGIARLHWGDQSMATAAGLIFGTARYISPEGAQGEKVGPQGDVYSIATMVYQMLSGRTPFGADQAVALLVQQIHDPPTPIDSIPRASYLPQPIAAAVMRNLSKKPEDRAVTARAFGRELLEAAMTSGLSAQDILARPAMLTGQRGSSSVVQMPSVQRTDKLQLDPQLEARMAAPPVPRNGTEALRATKTAFETPADEYRRPGDGRTIVRTEIPDPDPPRSVATTRWIPPPDLETRLRPPPSGVDRTMDEQETIPSRTLPLPTKSAEPAPPTSRTAAPPSRPPSQIEPATTEVHVPRRPWLHAWQRPAIVGLCLSLGALTMLVAYKGGILGRRSGQTPQLADSEAQAKDVPPRKRWELPGQSNSPDTPSSPADSPLPPLLSGRPFAGGSSASSAARAVIDASNGKPGVGQPVDFSARVVTASTAASRVKVEGAHFRVAGPGIGAGADLAASDDGSGVFRTTFTFLQGGRFEVTFLARADGSPVRSTRVIAVDGNPTLPQAPPSSVPSAAPAPTSGAQWL